MDRPATFISNAGRGTLAAVLALSVAAPARTHTQEPTPCVGCDSTLVGHPRRAYDEEIGRLQHQLDGLRRRADSLRATDTEDAREEGRALASEARQMSRALAALRSAARYAVAAETMPQMAQLQAARHQLWMLRTRARDRDDLPATRRPDGWLGVTISSESRVVGGSGTRVFYYDYPVVEAVEPGSPASAAGLGRGDTIIAYNGSDVRRHEVALGALLRPGSRVAVRVRRNGAEREVPVLVGRRPRAYAPQAAIPLDALGDIRGDAERITADLIREFTRRTADREAGHPPPPPSPRVAGVRDGSATGLLWAPPLPPSPFGAGDMAVAGAVVTSLTADLRDALGAPKGVLVVDVGAATPAEVAGLRGGDVIVRAGGEPVVVAQDLQRALQQSGNGTCELEVARKGQRRKVTLRW
ncbi:MAG: hypothetical protein NVS9B3_05660 [Gemmatimonadaceae bacterium]